MNAHLGVPLDNPVWHSLTSRHAELGRRLGDVARYRAEVAPVIGVRSMDAARADDLNALVQAGESVLFVGPMPVLPQSWQVRTFAPIAQMTCTRRLEIGPGPQWVELDQAHRPDVLALTALVYPHYFRPQTPDLGRYIGIYEGSQLVAMAGERMSLPGHQEISAICTHPDHLGRGHARRLMSVLNNAILDRGELPFLHVSHENPRAMQLYKHVGYVVRSDVGLAEAKRIA